MAPGLVAVRPSIALPVNPANGAAAGLAWPSGAGPTMESGPGGWAQVAPGGPQATLGGQTRRG